MSGTRNNTITLPSDEATKRLAGVFARNLVAGDTVLLSGPIGAGKTHFARAFIQAYLGRLEEVPSPTFTLVQTYEAPDVEIWHADLYRLSHADEVTELGLDTAFKTAICLIEWPEKLGDAMPGDAIHLALSSCGMGRSAAMHGGRDGLVDRIARIWAENA